MKTLLIPPSKDMTGEFPESTASSTKYTCHWCERERVLPMRIYTECLIATEPGWASSIAEPWVSVGRRPCCPECFESEIPPPILTPTET